MDFQDGAPPTEQPTQEQRANLTPQERFLLEEFERNEEFRRQSLALYHQVNSGQVQAGQQYPQQQARQESALATKRRELADVERKRTELERSFIRSGRNATQDEIDQWNALDRQYTNLENEIVRLESREAHETTQRIQQEQQVMAFQQAVGQRFAQFAQPKVNAFNVSAAEKQRLYNKLWELFTSHPFFHQISDIQAADILMKSCFDDLVANHGAPKQRSGGVGRTGDERNDIDSPEPEGDKDRFSHMPPELAALMRRRYPEGRPVN
jgi:hypothetical protein